MTCKDCMHEQCYTTDLDDTETCNFFIDKNKYVEARYGYWEAYWDDDYQHYYHRCSECKSDAPAKQGTMCDQALTKYCPHCGVNMGGKDDSDVEET